MTASLPPRTDDLPVDLPTDVRLVVVDMDGTLLDEHGEIPDTLWPMLERMRAAGIVFTPASGRQYATLARHFERASEGMVFIAENGALVVRDDEEISSDPLERSTVVSIIETVRGLAADGHDLGVVVCGRRSAYVERADRAFLDNVEPYYASLVTVEDVTSAADDAIKVAVYASAGAPVAAEPALEHLRATHRVVVSGANWLDVMGADVDKGVALRRLQAALGVTAAQTVVFGDYLNDLGMLDAAEGSFAMANAHPEVLARARHRAPSNVDHGVITVLEHLVPRPS